MRRPIRALVAAVALLSAVLFAGCGAGGDLLTTDAAATPQFLAQSAQRTAEVASGRVEVTITAGDGTVTATGSFDAPRRAAELHVEASTAGETLSSDVVVVDGSLYVRPGGLAGLLGEALGTPWLAVDVAELDDLLPDDLGMPTFDPADIDELAGRLRGEGIEVVEVGREDVRGTATTRYRATIPEDPAQQLPPVVVDVWVDDAGLVRRVDAVARGDLPVTVRAELFDLDADVSISAPPADEVTDLGDLGDLLELLPR